MISLESGLLISYVGDCGVDIYVDQKISFPGGIALNGAVHARKNFPVKDTISIITALGNDENAEIVRQTLVKNKIQENIAIVKGDTLVQFIKNTISGEKQFLQYKAGVIEGFEINDTQQCQVAKSDLVITVLFGQVRKLFESVIAVKRDKKSLLVVDFMDLGSFKKDVVLTEKYLTNIDIGFFGLDKKSDEKIIYKIKQLALKMNKLLVVTLGADGSIAFKGNKSYIQTASPVEKVVDTTGAGDAFSAAFLKSFVYTQDISSALKMGAEYASAIISKMGAF